MKTKSDIWIKVLSLGIGLAVGIVLIAKVFFELTASTRTSTGCIRFAPGTHNTGTNTITGKLAEPYL